MLSNNTRVSKLVEWPQNADCQNLSLQGRIKLHETVTPQSPFYEIPIFFIMNFATKPKLDRAA